MRLNHDLSTIVLTLLCSNVVVLAVRSSTIQPCPLADVLKMPPRRIASTVCEDTLASTPSPIQDCAVLISSYPCGTTAFGMPINTYCAKSCGLCTNGGSTNNSTTNNTTPTTAPVTISTQTPTIGETANEEGDVLLIRVDPMLASGEYTDFNITQNSVEITTRIPISTTWFGYHFFNFEVQPGDPDAALGYSFMVNSGNETITAEVFYLNYFGPTDDILSLGITDPVWECTAEAEAVSNGTICTYNAELGRGDFMVGTSGVTLGMRPQNISTRDFEMISTTNDGVFYTFIWRRSRYAPFDGSTVRVRYATAPTDLPQQDTIQTVLGYKYHGDSNHFNAELILDSASQNSTFGTVVDGLLQHVEMGEGSNDYLVGGSYGWNNPPPGATGFADLQTEVGSTLVFKYVGFHNVALFPSKDALENCNVSSVNVVGDRFASPFTLTLDKPGKYYIGSSTINADNIPITCQLGVRFTATVTGTDAITSSAATVYFLIPFMAMALSFLCIY